MRSVLNIILSRIKRKLHGGYDAQKYWRNRVSEFGLDLRGVGNRSLSEEENKEQYSEAKKVFLSICNENQIDFRNTSVLDIGCGTGFYTKIVEEQGCSRYCGVDITDALLNELKSQFSDYKFYELDVSRESLKGIYDLVIMIDVTQHITNKKRFDYAMQNIRNHLKQNGLLIVTSWLDDKKVDSFYEKSRSIDSYKKCFKGENFGEPLRFRDKYIFTIRKVSE